MAVSKTASNEAQKKPERMKPETWAYKKKTKPYVLEAVKCDRGWAAGKLVTESEYDGAITAWLGSAISAGR